MNDINRKTNEAIEREKTFGTGQPAPKRYQGNVQRMFDLIKDGHPTEHPELRKLAATVAASEAGFAINP